MRKEDNYIYREWQMDKSSIPTNIQNAWQVFFDKIGKPPQILETAIPLQEIELPEGMQLVISASHLPKNIVLMGMIEIEEDVSNNSDFSA